MRRRDEVFVGMLLTVAAAVAVIGTIWLTRGGLSKGYPLYTRFAWGQNLKQGQPVQLAGVSVGDVAEPDRLSGRGHRAARSLPAGHDRDPRARGHDRSARQQHHGGARGTAGR